MVVKNEDEKIRKIGSTGMSVSGNIGAFISGADTIEIRFSDNDELDIGYTDAKNDEEFKENENKKEELDYYIQKILNRNNDLKNIDFEEEYDEYELTEDYDLDEEHDIDEEYVFENEYLLEESKINFDNEIYLKKDVKYNNLDMINSYITDSDGNIENLELISKISYFLEQKNRFSILNRAKDKIITLLESTGIGICESNFLKNGTTEFELLPIINYNGSLEIGTQQKVWLARK